MPSPLITVLMPVYNSESFLNEAIESILTQTFKDFEFLIINDGSTDNSKNIIFSYNDIRIKYVENHSNIGLIKTLNKGFDLAKGIYIARMDADDICMPERLKKQFEFMEKNINICLCGSWYQTFGEINKYVKYATDNDEIRVRLLHQTQFCHPSVILRKFLLEEYNYIFDSNYLHAEDYEFFVRIAEKYKVANLPEVLLKYRTHKNSVTNLYNNIQAENTKKIIINQFKNFKIDFDNYDYDLYINFAYNNFKYFDRQKCIKLNELLCNLINENKKNEYLPSLKLKYYWADKFFNICYNVSNCFDIWVESVFYDKNKMTLLKKIKKQFKKFSI